MRLLAVSVAGVPAVVFPVAILAIAVQAAPAAAQQKCFDKGSLAYVDCPQPPAPPAPSPAPPPIEAAADWSGFYLGGHAGWAWADFDGGFRGLDFDDLSVDGPLAGGQIGFQREFSNRIVLGAELSASAVWAEDDAGATTLAIEGPPIVETIEAELDWLASARLRLGYAVDRFLPYVTGGAAWAGWSAGGSVDGARVDLDESAFGGVVGAGFEVKADENWILGIEGLYYFFDDEAENLSPPGLAGDGVALEDVFAGRARISYRF